jgi:N-acetyl-anhydromuramyl-L-alanine amidase AmpD
MTPNLFVIHWDGCTSAKQCFNVLVSRGLSVPFLLDNDATIYQTLNLSKSYGWHAGHVNPRALGVEIANPVLPERNKYCDPPRPVTTMQVRGDKHQILGFYEAQLAALVQLLDWCCSQYPIPRQIPAYKGKPGHVANSYIKGPGDVWDVMGFKGICGHFHQDDNKCDPGMDVWSYILANLPGCTVVETA